MAFTKTRAEQIIELTDEIRQGKNEDILAWLVFNLYAEYAAGRSEEYSVFADEKKARQHARKNSERLGKGVTWKIYPLYASHPVDV